MSSQFKVAGEYVTVDQIFQTMEEGNKQHMANKLFKHGWVPVKVVRYLPEDVYESMVDRRNTDISPCVYSEDDLELGDRVTLTDFTHEWTGEYIVAKTGEVPGGRGLISLSSGNLWSDTSLLGTSHGVEYVFKKLNKEK